MYRYPAKTYLHFDNKAYYNKKVENYVLDFRDNQSHSFLPLIYGEIKSYRYKEISKEEQKNYEVNNEIADKRVVRDGKLAPITEKIRPIMYASHIDNYIYKHYGMEINELYNKYVIENGFDECVTAYRNNKEGKSNIHFSAEIINFIARNANCYIYVGDYSGFFDTLNHDYLKRMLLKLYGSAKLPRYQYKIFRNITNYSYIYKEDINNYLGKDEEIRLSGERRYFSNIKDFREFKNMESLSDVGNSKALKKNSDDFGIPQGTAISAIYSNVYMLEIDKFINGLVNESGGLYRRYSDDFIVVLPNKDIGGFKDIVERFETKIKNEARLEIHPDKTQIMKFDGTQLLNLENQTNERLDYLGFTYNGKDVRMREKSIYKFYRTAYKLIDKGRIVSNKKGNIGAKKRLTYKRKLYQNYHQLGERTDIKYKYKTREYGTFISYANKSQRVFDKISPMTNNLMKNQIKNHKKNINKKIKNAVGKLN